MKSLSVFIAVIAITVAIGCPSVSQHVPTDEDCQTEAQVLRGIEAAVDAADIAIPEGLDGRDEALSYAREGLEIGAAAVSSCEATRDESSWMMWIPIALKFLRGLVSILRLADVEIPGALGDVFDLLVPAASP